MSKSNFFAVLLFFIIFWKMRKTDIDWCPWYRVIQRNKLDNMRGQIFFDLTETFFFYSDAPETTMNSSWPVPKQLPDLSVFLLAVIICVPEWILMPYRTNHSKHGTFFKVSLRLVHFTPLCLALVVCAECRCPLLQRHTTIINCVMHHISPCKGKFCAREIRKFC